eukprot:gb/GECG01003331.1/.p1 GENE.gb/GECG01003331.1/~~gb/GECG01003331.1/.p1  ORF type:complete len:119 (+),score=10.37 gb/GECG01003331.1/:1-357(+)
MRYVPKQLQSLSSTNTNTTDNTTCRHPQVRRLINVVDTLYERKVKLFVSAAAEPQELFKPEGHEDVRDYGSSRHHKASAQSSSSQHYDNVDEVFAFNRTVSRLIEMQSEEYIRAEWKP